mgnify:CR=1 FL=1
MTNDNNVNDIYSKLLFFKDKNIKVHIKLVSGFDIGKFRNCYVKEISKEHSVVLIEDDVIGQKTYTFSEIDPDIKYYTEPEGERK